MTHFSEPQPDKEATAMPMQWDNKISTGHVLTVAGMFAAGFLAWADVKGTGTKNAADIIILQQDTRQNDNRLRSVEISVASMISTLQSIQVGVSEIKVEVKRVLDAPHPATRN